MCNLIGKVTEVSMGVDGIRFSLISRDDEAKTELFIENCSELDILQISSESGFIVTCLVNDRNVCEELYI
jgi:hypothetical protein